MLGLWPQTPISTSQASRSPSASNTTQLPYFSGPARSSRVTRPRAGPAGRPEPVVGSHRARSLLMAVKPQAAAACGLPTEHTGQAPGSLDQGEASAAPRRDPVSCLVSPATCRRPRSSPSRGERVASSPALPSCCCLAQQLPALVRERPTQSAPHAVRVGFLKILPAVGKDPLEPS